MSAIAGIIHFKQEPINLEHSHNIMRQLQKFPANYIGLWYSSKGNAFLGCHDQWITPESVSEEMPLNHYESQLTITADAIIDNRSELFESLQVSKSEQNTITDAKLILLAYQKWGEDCPKHLIGDFAFMIWDEKYQKLFGARDFSGTRTLYFYQDEQRVAFCTIMAPLLSLPFVQNDLNEEWLAEFLAIPTTFDSVNPLSTTFKKIAQIPPSHTLAITEGKMRLSRYVKFNFDDKLIFKKDSEYEEAFREVYQKAIKARLRTRHGVGSHLSGGLDSGSVVGFAARMLKNENKSLHTFSYIPVDGFVDWTHKRRVADERPYIQATVRHVGNINDHYLEFADQNPFTEIDEWLDVLEMPYKFFENTFWLRGIYKKAQEKGIGILLNGQRGNWTVSWGPAHDYYVTLYQTKKMVKLLNETRLYGRNIGVKTSKILKAVKHSAQSHDIEYEEDFPIMIHPDFAKKTNVYEKLKSKGIDLLGAYTSKAYDIKRKQFDEVFFWGINGTYGTKLSLRHSLWDRDPTNDLEVIRFCLSVPENQYVKGGLDRALLRRATKGYLPDEVRLNHQTRGVQGSDGVHRMAPKWHQFIEELELLIADPLISEYLNKSVLKRAINKIKEQALPEYAFDYDFRILMRSLIFYRFLKRITFKEVIT
jgi:asparagine synthase (glutamine-hydrolysing)